jgi:hypothetical protein
MLKLQINPIEELVTLNENISRENPVSLRVFFVVVIIVRLDTKFKGRLKTPPSAERRR